MLSSRSGHPSSPAGTRLYGRRVVLRPLMAPDWPAWSEIRRRNGEWLTRWEPLRMAGTLDPVMHREAFANRCATRDKERQYGQSHCFGLFVDGALAGEVNINNVQRGASQTATIGYWIDQARAGHGYMPEAVVVALRHCFEDLHLHRIEVCIVPRNRASHRVAEKLILRHEGVALRFIEINGVWEDHVRYAMTVEEWHERRVEMTRRWLAD